MLGQNVPRLVGQHRCALDSGRVIELLEYDAAIGVGEDGRATRWDSIVRDEADRIVDSSALSETLVRAMLRAAASKSGAAVV